MNNNRFSYKANELWDLGSISILQKKTKFEMTANLPLNVRRVWQPKTKRTCGLLVNFFITDISTATGRIILNVILSQMTSHNNYFLF